MKKILLLLLLAIAHLGLSANNIVQRDKQTNEIIHAKYKLLNYLKKKQGIQTLFGHQDDTVYGHDWWNKNNKSDVYETSGKYPSVYGWELGGIENGSKRSLDSVKFKDIRKQIIIADSRGGINTISWHLNNPTNNHSAWDKTNHSVYNILYDKQTNIIYRSWVKRLSKFFKSLKRSDGTLIPILFRPFHEMNGNWFWWGKSYCTKQEYIKLWILTEKLLESYNVHNLLYIYSTDNVNSKEEYMERYPGDNLVNILGVDCYHRNGNIGIENYKRNANNVLRIVKSEAQMHNKVYVFSETGCESISVNNWYTEILYPILHKYHPAYILIWRNAYTIKNHFFVPYQGHKEANDFKRFTDSKDIIMQSNAN